MTSPAPGATAVRAFLLLTERLGTGRRPGVPQIAEGTGIALREEHAEAGPGYRHYHGRGTFAGLAVSAELRAPRIPRVTSPLLLILRLAERSPLGISLTAEYGPPDSTAPPDPHDPLDAPEYTRYRRGQALASIGEFDGQLDSLILRIPA